jgi:tryptophan halogenase
VVAIGLSGGSPEAAGIDVDPHDPDLQCAPAVFCTRRALRPEDIDEFNRLGTFELERVRDFLILPYHATTRSDTPSWDHVRTMSVPETLKAKIVLYRSRVRITRGGNESFSEVAWLQVREGRA